MLRPPVVPLRKGDKKSQAFGLAKTRVERTFHLSGAGARDCLLLRTLSADTLNSHFLRAAMPLVGNE